MGKVVCLSGLPPIHCPSPSTSAPLTFSSSHLSSPSSLSSQPQRALSPHGGLSILATCRPVSALGCCCDFTAGAGLGHPQEHKQTPHLPHSSWTGNFHTLKWPSLLLGHHLKLKMKEVEVGVPRKSSVTKKWSPLQSQPPPSQVMSVSCDYESSAAWRRGGHDKRRLPSSFWRTSRVSELLLCLPFLG